MPNSFVAVVIIEEYISEGVKGTLERSKGVEEDGVMGFGRILEVRIP